MLETLITSFVHHITSVTLPRASVGKIDVVVGLDARGFLIGPIIAMRLGAAFVPVRKRGKLPGECVNATYEKEYGPVSFFSTPPPTSLLCIKTRAPPFKDTFEMQVEAIKPGQTVIVVDDLLATGMLPSRLSTIMADNQPRRICKIGRRTRG